MVYEKASIFYLQKWKKIFDILPHKKMRDTDNYSFHRKFEGENNILRRQIEKIVDSKP
jgi:hypothetical protein